MSVVLPSCGQQINNPAPVIVALDPSTKLAGQPQFTLSVTGKSFTPSSFVEWNGSPRITLFQNENLMTATITAADIQSPGTASVVVVTQSPGGGTTATLTFTITPLPSNVPQITKISPTGVFVNSGSFPLTVTGLNFVSQSSVTVNGSSRPTSFLNSTSLQATIPATDLGTTGTLQIAVLNPAPGGGSSNALPLKISNPVPRITAVAPTTIQAGSAPPTLSVTGSSLAPNSVILINGTARPTTLISATQLSTTLTAGDLAAGGTNQIQVFSPPPGGGNSNVLPFSVIPSAAAGLPVLVDVAPDGTQANNAICGATCLGTTPDLTTAGPSASSTGEFIAFASISSNLITSDLNPSSDVFVRDTCLGSSSTCVPTNTLVSLGTTNGPANGASSEPSIDTAGTHVAFTSTATNLVATVPVTGGTRQVFWNQTCTGTTCATTTPPTQLVSMSADGTAAGNNDNFNPAISPDGRYVAFASLATNLVSNVSFNGITPQIFLRDTCNGITTTTTPASTCVPTTFLISSSDGLTPGNGASSDPAVANNGLYVSFTSTAGNLGSAAPNPNGAEEIFENSTCVGLTGCTISTTLISTPDSATAADGSSIDSSISKEGRFVAFASTARNLGIASGGIQQIYLRDTCTGQPSTCAPATVLISTPNGTTPGNDSSEHPSMDQTGQFISFASRASNLSGSAANGIENIYVLNSCLTVTTTTSTTPCTVGLVLASAAAGSSPPPANGNSIVPSLSGDGTVVSFISSANDLVARDSNGLPDIFLARATLLFTLSVNISGTGIGTVSDSLGLINCNNTNGTQEGTCTASYPNDSSVTLTETPGTNSTFGTWSVSTDSTLCTTTGSCTFTITGTTSVTATFNGS
ncbi:MAG: hypothetical protein WBP79_13475 [Candidatus Acidiferrales bacterium]